MVVATPAAQTTVPPPPPPHADHAASAADHAAAGRDAVRRHPHSTGARPPQAIPEIITEAQLRSHMEFLASDALQGRAGGTRDEWIAATYVASQLRRVGVEPMGDNGTYIQAIELVVEEAVTAPVLTEAVSRSRTARRCS